MIIDYSVLFLILFLGAVSSFTDIKYGKIKNIHITWSLIFGIIVSISSIFLSENVIIHLLYLLINVVVALIIGFMFWSFGFWTAGDGKLYIAFSIILSSIFQGQSVLNYAFFSVLVYTFIPFFFFFAVISIFRAGFEKSISTIGAAFKPMNILRIVLFFFGAGYVFSFVPFFTGSFFLSYFMMFVFYLIVEKSLGKIQLGFFALLSIFRIIFDVNVSYYSFMISFGIMIIIMTLFRYAFVDLGFYAFTKEKKIKDLIEGDVPAEVVFKKGDLYRKERFNSFGISRSNSQYPDQIYEITPEGLKLETIKKLQDIVKKRNSRFKELRVYDILPFAPFMFFGTLITYFLSILGITIFI